MRLATVTKEELLRGGHVRLRVHLEAPLELANLGGRHPPQILHHGPGHAHLDIIVPRHISMSRCLVDSAIKSLTCCLFFQ